MLAVPVGEIKTGTPSTTLLRTNEVSVNDTMVTSPSTPARIAVGKLIMVSLVLNVQRNPVDWGSEEAHLVGPSSTVPVLSALKVIMLSLSQGSISESGTGISPVPSLLTSSEALSYFQAARVSLSVLVFAFSSLSSSLSQAVKQILPDKSITTD